MLDVKLLLRGRVRSGGWGERAAQARRLGRAGLTCGLVLMLCPPAGAASFQGLGDLPGGSVNSSAYGVSADGSVVVGQSLTASGWEAFR